MYMYIYILKELTLSPNPEELTGLNINSHPGGINSEIHLPG